MTFQRVVQTISFISFIVLLSLAAFPLIPLLPVDLFLRLDPLVFLGTSLSARVVLSAFGVTVFVLLFTMIAGRFFCSTLCPMGATLDVTDRIICSPKSGKRQNSETVPASLKYVKYQILVFILGAALMGISPVFLASPLSLITRFYGLILYPSLGFLGQKILTLIRPLADHFDIPSLVYAQMATPRFALQWFNVLLFGAIFACALRTPRFWCRYLCPSGAVFALFSQRPLWRRQVSQECIQCGLCRKKCPMNAIGVDPFTTDHGECIVCETCVRVCPTQAIRFSGPRFKKNDSLESFSPGRRRLIWAGFSGIGTALVAFTELRQLYGDPGPGRITDPHLIRPPGALPEKDFLARCIRCGECMKACPTNTLQPIGLIAGASAFFSPKMIPRRGPCEPLCNVCGHVCPTGAVRPLPLPEKIWAKVGTAYVLRHKCLAWEFGQRCLVCDEVCPYDAVEFRQVPGIPVDVPFVNEAKCAGCGFCEHHCPVQAQAAIVVEPMGALRLESGSYRQEGLDNGLSLKVREKGPYESGPSERETGAFETGDDAGSLEKKLPPGFTE